MRSAPFCLSTLMTSIFLSGCYGIHSHQPANLANGLDISCEGHDHVVSPDHLALMITVENSSQDWQAVEFAIPDFDSQHIGKPLTLAEEKQFWIDYSPAYLEHDENRVLQKCVLTKFLLGSYGECTDTAQGSVGMESFRALGQTRKIPPSTSIKLMLLMHKEPSFAGSTMELCLTKPDEDCQTFIVETNIHPDETRREPYFTCELPSTWSDLRNQDNTITAAE